MFILIRFVETQSKITENSLTDEDDFVQKFEKVFPFKTISYFDEVLSKPIYLKVFIIY